MTGMLPMKMSAMSNAHAEPQCNWEDDDIWVRIKDDKGMRLPQWHLERDALRVQTEDSEPEPFGPVGQDFAADEDGENGTNFNMHRIAPTPESVICALVLTVRECATQKEQHQRKNQTGYGSGKKYLLKQHQRVRWQNSQNHTKLHETMEDFVKRQNPVKRAYLSTSYVRLLEWQKNQFKEVDSCIVESKENWARSLPRMIARFCGQDGWSPFFLEFNAEYEQFTVVDQAAGQFSRTYAGCIGATLSQTARKNFENREYWSKKLLKRLFDKDTVTKLVNEHFDKRKTKVSTRRRLQLDTSERHELIEWLWPNRIRLVAIMVRINGKIDDLYHLMKRDDDYHDGMIPLKAEYLEQFLGEKQRPLFPGEQRGFVPVDFQKPDDLEELQVKDDELIPIHFDKEHDKIDRGGTSEVYRATINPDYHAFACDKRKPFALKRMSGMALKDAREEARVWRYISRQPHKHINRVYTWWLQNHHFYMLSPLGDRNLRDFLWSEPKPELMYQGEWLLEQLEGLASGIERIHHVGRARLGLSNSRSDKADYGYHHDLKPANILMFDNVWKITDFGTAKIRRLMSSSPQSGDIYTLNLPGGDEEYGGPERIVVRNGKYRTGRAYDIWSFGCILLEVLLWCFGRTKENLRAFREERRHLEQVTCACKPSQKSLSDQTDSNCSSDTDEDTSRKSDTSKFWYRCEKAGRRHLKPCVQVKLNEVEQEANDHCPILKELCRLVGKMLQISPKARPEASVVLGKIGNIRVAAEVYFAKQRQEADASGPNLSRSVTAPSRTNDEGDGTRSFRLSSNEPTDCCPSDAPDQRLQSPQDSRKRRYSEFLEVQPARPGGMPTPTPSDLNHIGSNDVLKFRVDHERPAEKRLRQADRNGIREEDLEESRCLSQVTTQLPSPQMNVSGEGRPPRSVPTPSTEHRLSPARLRALGTRSPVLTRDSNWGLRQRGGLSDSRPLAEKMLDLSPISPQRSLSM